MNLFVLGEYKAPGENAGAAKRRTDAELVVLNCFPGPNEPGITAKAAWSKSGHKSWSHFHKIAKRLKDDGKIEQEGANKGKYRRAKV